MEKSLKLYIDNNRGEQVSFPEGEEQIEISAFTADYKRMGGAPTITCTVKHPTCLDDKWNYGVYTVFNGERFYLKKTPSSSRSNKDARYIHELELCSERVQLDNVFVFDVTVDGEAKPVSNNTEFSFFGTIRELAEKLNSSLKYSGLQSATGADGYRVVVDESIVETEGKLISIQNNVFSEVLQESFKTFAVPYYFVGKTIHLGFSPSTSAQVFEYGATNSLLSISKQNAGAKVINRITGFGSEDNLPYYYPNQSSIGDVYLTYNNSTDGVFIKDQEKFSKNKLSNEFVFYNYDGQEVAFMFFPVVIEDLTYVDTFEYRVRYYRYPDYTPPGKLSGYKRECRKYKCVYTQSFHIDKVRTGSLQINWSWGLSSLVDDKPVFKLYKVLPSENKLMHEWKGEVTQTEFTWLHKENKLYESSMSQPFHTLETGDYLLEITQYMTDLEVLSVEKVKGDKDYKRWDPLKDDDFIDVEPISDFTDLFSIIQDNTTCVITYKEDPVQFWTLNDAAVQLSDYGIKTSRTPSSNDTIRIVQGEHSWIVPQKRLIPPKYRDTFGMHRFYNAENETYINPDTNEYYEFANRYIAGNPREHIAEFDDIKPSIVGITNKDGELINSFIDFAYDENDNDEIDEEGNYIHPYFFAKLRKFNGQKNSADDKGFNLFDHALESGEMTISMTSGVCGACQWVIGVDQETKQNLVQVDDNGVLLRDKDGDVICGRKGAIAAQDKQQDTVNNEVWIALKKDNQTFHTIMPNATSNYKPSVGDTFVILHIHLPHSYILAAEKRLEDEIIRYMAENNDEKFNFSIDFSRIYLAENPDVLPQINENARIRIKYNGKEHLLYVSSFSYSMKDNAPLPEIKVELNENLEIGSNAIQQAVTQAESAIDNKIATIDVLALTSPYFHRKDVKDETPETQTFKAGVTIGTSNEFGIDKDGIATLSNIRTKNFSKGFEGAAVYEENGNTHIEADFINIRKKATFKEVEIQTTKHIGGKQLLTATTCVCDKVEELFTDATDEEHITAFKVYFRRFNGEGDTITNEWQIGDQARCDTFNIVVGKDGNQGNHYFWRLVTNVGTGGYTQQGEDMSEYHWIVLSNLEIEEFFADKGFDGLGYDENSDAPLAGDNIVQLGNRLGTEGRTSAIELAGAGTDSPYIRQYEDITSFTLGDVDTQIKPGDNKFKGKLEVSDGSRGIGAFTDLPDEVNKAVKIGGENLLRNTGFDGDYASQKMEEFESISEDDKVYGQNLEFWTLSSKATVTSVESHQSVSGYACRMAHEGDWIKQDITLIPEENYVLSFVCQGVFFVREEQKGVQDEIKRCRVDITGTGDVQTIEFKAASPNALIWDVKLERGMVQTDWSPAREDNDKMAGEFKDLWYLQHAFKGKTEILGGLILSSLIQLGMYRNGQMEGVTAGISGILEDQNTDVAFWGGGTLEQAMLAVEKFRDNPLYQPTDAELANMAKAVITHGGRAILNDIVLRGYIYALGGVFKGRIEAKEGYFLGNTRNVMVDITQDNIHEFAISGDGTFGNQYYLDFDKTGFCFRFSGRFEITSVYIQLPYMTPLYPSLGVERDDLRATNFNRVLIFNNGEGINVIGVGVTLPNGTGSTYAVRFGEVFEGSANLVYSYDGAVGEGLLWSVKVHRNEIEDEEPQPISPKVYAYGSVASDGSISYTSFDEQQVSCAKQTTSGQYIVTFSSSWFNSADDYIVSLTGVGFVEDSNSSPVKATLLGKTKSSITVCTSDDDSPNYGAFDFVIMKK